MMSAWLLAALAASAQLTAAVPEVEGRAVASFADRVEARRFFKGCLHSHSNDHAERSYEKGKGDGDVPPAAVLAAYASRGYAFVSLTDHNQLTPVSGALTALPGIELTSRYGPKPARPVHVNAICVRSEAKGVSGPEKSGAEVLAETVALARGAGAALVVVNHPNYANGLVASDLEAVVGFDAVELRSGHKQVNADDAEAPVSAEAMWDRLLRAGRRVWAVAADDAHHFKGSGDAYPGQAWVSAWAPSAGREDVCAALKAGRFYASAGPELKFLTVDGDSIALEVSGRWDPNRDRVEFIADGEVVSTARTAAASYKLAGGQSYVRARVIQGGKRAWTQAYRAR